MSDAGLEWLGEDAPEGVDTGTGEIADEPSEQDEQDTEYSTVGQFVHEYLLPTFPKPVEHSLKWCPQWWLHEEAVENFTALWRSWETSGAAEMAGWLRDYLYPLMDRMLSKDGPFSECHPKNGCGRPQVAPLPMWELPEGM